jgi:hypothetical protein
MCNTTITVYQCNHNHTTRRLCDNAKANEIGGASDNPIPLDDYQDKRNRCRIDSRIIQKLNPHYCSQICAQLYSRLQAEARGGPLVLPAHLMQFKSEFKQKKTDEQWLKDTETDRVATLGEATRKRLRKEDGQAIHDFQRRHPDFKW